jgi:hypothetical protein
MPHQRSEIHELTRSKIPQKKSRVHLKATAKQRKQTPKVISKKDLLCAVPDCPDPGGGLSVVQSSDYRGHLAGLSGGTRLTITVNGGLSAHKGRTVRSSKAGKRIAKKWFWTWL